MSEFDSMPDGIPHDISAAAAMTHAADTMVALMKLFREGDATPQELAAFLSAMYVMALAHGPSSIAHTMAHMARMCVAARDAAEAAGKSSTESGVILIQNEGTGVVAFLFGPDEPPNNFAEVMAFIQGVHDGARAKGAEPGVQRTSNSRKPDSDLN